MTTIIGIKLSNRSDCSLLFQKIISNFGCYIKTRIGLHNDCNNPCSNYGLILLEITDNSIVPKLENELIKIDNIELQQMKFN